MPDSTPPTVLVAYFSRAGENYFNGGRRDLAFGNTEVLAELITELITADVYRIEAADAYSADYDPTVERNLDEQHADARPAIAHPLASIDSYDIILLGNPIWNMEPPMIMRTFLEAYDLTGKTIHPFVTHAMSGLGTTVQDYTDACPGATIGPGLAVRGELVDQARPAVEAWLARIGLRPRSTHPDNRTTSTHPTKENPTCERP